MCALNQAIQHSLIVKPTAIIIVTFALIPAGDAAFDRVTNLDRKGEAEMCVA